MEEGGEVPREELLALFKGVPEEDILGAFVFGSRAFGTATPTSDAIDWDFYVVLSGALGPLAPSTNDPEEERWAVMVEGNNVDATVYVKDYWCEMLEFHDIHTIFCQYNHPPHLTLYKKLDIPFDLELLKLKYSTYAYISGHKEYAHKLWHKGDQRGSKKGIVHALRFILMAYDVAKSRSANIPSYLDANVYHSRLFDTSNPEYLNISSWEQLEKWFDPIYDRLALEFKEYANVYKLISAMGEEEEEKEGGKNLLAIQRYLSNHNKIVGNKEGIFASLPAESMSPWRYLKEELSISAIRSYPSTHPELMQLNHDSSASPLDCPAVNDCCGIVLRERKKENESESEKAKEEAEWEVVCFPFRKVNHFNGGDKEVEGLPLEGFNWKGAKLYEQPVGISLYLYHYQGQWLLSSSHNNAFTRSIKERFTTTATTTTTAKTKREREEEFKEALEGAFWWTWKEKLKYRLPEDESLCYMFRFYAEPFPHLTLPFIPPVDGDSNSNEVSIILTGVRNMDTYEEMPPHSIAHRYGWECVREREDLYSHTLHTNIDEKLLDGGSMLSTSHVKKILRALLEASRKVSLLDASGFILCDPSYQRIVLHSPQYQDLYRLKRFTHRFNKQPLVLSIVRSTYYEKDRFCVCYPQWAAWFTKVHDKLAAFAEDVQRHYDAELSFDSDRDFAAKLKSLGKKPRRHPNSYRKHPNKQKTSTTDTTTNINDEKEKEVKQTNTTPTTEKEKEDKQINTTPTTPTTTEGVKGYKMGDLAKLYWAMRKHDDCGCLEYLLSAEGRKDESMTKKVEDWLWKEENTITAASFKTVRPRHVTMRSNTEG